MHRFVEPEKTGRYRPNTQKVPITLPIRTASQDRSFTEEVVQAVVVDEINLKKGL
jgi:hypothetical protein